MKYLGIFFVLTWHITTAQLSYTFDHLLAYEVRNLQQQTVVSQLTLINAADNSYYALVTRLADGTLEFFIEDKERKRYQRIYLQKELRDGDILNGSRKSFKKMICNLPKKRRPRIVNLRDTLVHGKPYSLFDMKPEKISTFHGDYPYTYKYWIDTTKDSFIPNFTGELCTDDWNNYDLLPSGIVSKRCVVDSQGRAAGCSTLKSVELVNVVLQIK